MKNRILGAALVVVSLALPACEKSKAPAPASPASEAPAAAGASGHAAQPEHAHAAPHGGVVSDTATGHLELVASRDGAFKLYVLDADMKTRPVTDASATLKLTLPGYADVKLSPEGDALAGRGEPFHAEHVTAVASVTVGGATQAARFPLHLGAAGHGEGHAHGGHDVAAPGYKAELSSQPAEPVAGRPVMLAFTVKDAKGTVVRELPLAHEKPMHLLVVSSDLQDFAHLHPEARPDGSYGVTHTFPSGGDYTLFVDYTPKGSPQVVDRFPLTVKGSPRAKVALKADSSPTQTVDGLRVTMTPDKPLRAGEGLMLQFAVADARSGKPAADLEPYLGAMAHFVIISEDSKDFLHAHPMDGGANAPGTVAAHTTFPREGLYKLWVQVQRKGQVVTVPFVVNVSAGAPAAAAPAPQGGHEHGHAH